MKAEIINNPQLISYCGLYCPACNKFLNGKCPGCQKNEKAGWCKVRTCNMDKGTASCADCNEFPDPMGCKKFNNPISKIFALVFKSDRPASIRFIRENGYNAYAAFMTENKLQVIKRKRK